MKIKHWRQRTKWRDPTEGRYTKYSRNIMDTEQKGLQSRQRVEKTLS